MEPNEIKLLQAANGIQAVAMREMAHIYAAEKDGRLVVLPFKVGEKVWLTSAFFQDFEKPVPAMVQKVEWNGENSLVPCQIFIWADIGSGLRAYGFSAESIGHNFFLTYEEAEAALLRKDNGI